MSKILQFPKNKSRRVRARNRLSAQRWVLTLSLFSFILIAVFSNEQVMKNQRPVYLISDNSPRSLDQLNRAIASAQPMNLFRDVEWEHSLAERLAKSSDRVPASTSQKLTMLDHLRYGVLAGKYRLISSGSALAEGGIKLREIEYVDSLEIADRPVQIADHQKFLRQYRDLLPVDFSKSVMAKSEQGTETWHLLSDKGQVVGVAKMRFDESGHFLGLKVEPQESLDRVSGQE